MTEANIVDFDQARRRALAERLNHDLPRMVTTAVEEMRKRGATSKEIVRELAALVAGDDAAAERQGHA
jgi:hypothetical protein